MPQGWRETERRCESNRVTGRNEGKWKGISKNKQTKKKGEFLEKTSKRCKRRKCKTVEKVLGIQRKQGLYPPWGQALIICQCLALRFFPKWSPDYFLKDRKNKEECHLFTLAPSSLVLRRSVSPFFSALNVEPVRSWRWICVFCCSLYQSHTRINTSSVHQQLRKHPSVCFITSLTFIEAVETSDRELFIILHSFILCCMSNVTVCLCLQYFSESFTQRGQAAALRNLFNGSLLGSSSHWTF